MKTRKLFLIVLAIAVGLYIVNTAITSSAQKIGRSDTVKKEAAVSETVTDQAAPIVWQTVVNNSFSIPGGTRKFSSYGQPSVNSNGTVVFRARSTRGQHETGIYMRPFPKNQLIVLGDLNTAVPEPNNLDSKYLEFSAIPRIAENMDIAAFRGMHNPVYRFLLPDGTETRVGTTGLYAWLGGPSAVTGGSKVGLAPGFDLFNAQTWTGSIPFDVFPGSPAINDHGVVAFKGNFTDGDVGKTGVFVRYLLNAHYGGGDVTEMIASSDTEIPGAPTSAVDDTFKAMTFGSTAPPSIAGHQVVFVGLDVEEDPYYGGIYRAWAKGGTDLEPLVEIGKPIPGTKVFALRRIGEGLSFTGRYLAFWGAWGDEWKTVRLNCPVDGNQDIINYCNGVDPKSIFDEETDQWYQLHQVPSQQGIILMDLETGANYLVAATNGDYTDFLFWGYSGKAPGDTTDPDAEPPRWRSAAYMAVNPEGLLVFKARTAEMNSKHEYINITDGLYLGDPIEHALLEPLVETGMDGALIDQTLTPGSLPVVGIGIERDGFRGRYLAITASMANAEEGWGGIYIAQVRRSGGSLAVNKSETKR